MVYTTHLPNASFLSWMTLLYLPWLLLTVNRFGLREELVLVRDEGEQACGIWH